MAPSVLRPVLQLALAAPPGLRHRLAGDPPRNARGAVLDPDVHLMAWLEARVMGSLVKGSPAEARAAFRRAVAIVASAPLPVPVEDTLADGVPVRLYRGGGPVLVYLHGGGWTIGDLDVYDVLCRRLAVEAGRLVVSVGYRLAPEHPFPQGLDDVVTALRWARRLGPRVEVGGDSAGGNLSAAASIVLRDAGEPVPALQVLIYPGLDQRRVHPSHREFAGGPMLTSDDLDWYQGHYGYPDAAAPLASPGLVADARGLPPAIVATAGFDPLRDEGEAFAARLREAGVPVTHLDEATLPHGYASMDGAIPEADRAVRRLIAALRGAG